MLDGRNYGIITHRNELGRFKLWMTYSESDRMWWIVIVEDPNDGDGLISHNIGYREPRRSACWDLFINNLTSEAAVEVAVAGQRSN